MIPFAFLFPGQGSQSVGMLDAWGDHPVVRQTLEEASAVLRFDVEQLVREGPRERLDLTANTQPVMLAAGIACYRAWLSETGLAPGAVAGHSLGEYSALVAAGVLTLADALGVVRLRAQAMQEAVPVGQGAMAAIVGLPAEVVMAGCAAAAAASGEVVEAVNFNDPIQTVIAGSKAGVDVAALILRTKGAKKVVPLPVSAPFHCSLMRPAAEHLKARLADTPMAAPCLPVINNIDVREAADADAIRDALYRQAFGPVRWVEVVRSLRARGLRHIFECGPGKVLVRLVKRIEADAVSAAVFDPASLADARGLLT